MILAGILFVGCEVGDEPSTYDAIVVESYAVAGRPLQGLRISRTVSPAEALGAGNDTFMPVSDASVMFWRGSVLFSLVEDTSRIPDGYPPRSNHGTYRPASGDTILPYPGDLLSLVISWQGRVIEAFTTVPPQVAIMQAPSAVAPSSPSFDLTISPDSLLIGFLVVAKIDHSQPLNPQYNGYNFLVTSQTTITVPMAMLHNMGTCKIYVYAIDQSYMEYLKTRKTGNPTQSLFQASDIISGGLGLFAAATVDSVEILIQ